MFKDLVKAHFGDDYDMSSLESFVQELLNTEEIEDAISTSSRTNGIYRESISGGNIVGDLAIHRNALVYELTLIE
jgi:hypothetical protein